jgi:hypothetical protein
MHIVTNMKKDNEIKIILLRNIVENYKIERDYHFKDF